MTPKTHPFHIHVPREPVDLWEKLRRLAAQNRRPIKEEALLAIENRLEAAGLLTSAEIDRLSQPKDE